MLGLELHRPPWHLAARLVEGRTFKISDLGLTSLHRNADFAGRSVRLRIKLCYSSIEIHLRITGQGGGGGGAAYSGQEDCNPGEVSRGN